MAEGKTAKKGTYRSNSAAFLAAQPAQDPFGCYKPKKNSVRLFYRKLPLAAMAFGRKDSKRFKASLRVSAFLAKWNRT